MSNFERTYQIEPLRESDCKREHSSIELTDQEYLNKREEWRIFEPCKIPKMEESYEQVENEKPKRKPAKVPAKSNKAAVARLQKKL